MLQFYSASPERLSGKQIPVAGGLDVTFNEPLGVVARHRPVELPDDHRVVGLRARARRGQRRAGQAGRDHAADHDAARPSSALEAGLPDGLFQVLPGKGSVVGERFITHPDVRKIVFTGSTEVGIKVMAGAAQQVKRVTLELGGKSANIVFDDCDLEKAAATAPYGVFDNAGQDCCARSRILVQRNVYDRFMELLEPAVKGVVVGDPTSRDTEMGPLVSRPHFDTVSSYVPDDAPVAFRGSAPERARILVPANGVSPRSAPTARSPRRSSGRSSRCCRSTTRPTRSRSPTTPPTVCPARSGPTTCRGRCGCRARWKSGNLSVNSHSSVRYNTPFGGFKQSGLGRELGPDAPLHFTETKNVFFAIGEL